MSQALSKLYDGHDAVVDIVFVHGLKDDRETWTNGDIFWPKDILPTDIKNARIVSFDYDAKIEHFWSPSPNEIDNHGHNLFDNLIRLREKTKTNSRPIIFVAHSLGGLVCAQALAFANNGRRQTISDCTRGIIFFGTPHAGSNRDEWTQRGKAFFDYMGKNYPSAEDLDKASETLSRLGKGFRDLLSRRANEPNEIGIMCFFEGEETNQLKSCPPPHQVVPEHLACLGEYPKQPIPADHSSMCKFKGRDDPSYGKVSTVLQEWVKALGTISGEKDTTREVHASFSGQFYGSPAVGLAKGGAHIAGGGTFNFGAASFGSRP